MNDLYNHELALSGRENLASITLFVALAEFKVTSMDARTALLVFTDLNRVLGLVAVEVKGESKIWISDLNRVSLPCLSSNRN